MLTGSCLNRTVTFKEYLGQADTSNTPHHSGFLGLCHKLGIKQNMFSESKSLIIYSGKMRKISCLHFLIYSNIAKKSFEFLKMLKFSYFCVPLEKKSFLTAKREQTCHVKMFPNHFYLMILYLCF